MSLISCESLENIVSLQANANAQAKKSSHSSKLCNKRRILKHHYLCLIRQKKAYRINASNHVPSPNVSYMNQSYQYRIEVCASIIYATNQFCRRQSIFVMQCNFANAQALRPVISLHKALRRLFAAKESAFYLLAKR